MAAAPSVTAEGSLYELVARGNKDAFFYQDFFNSKYIFENSYKPQPPTSFEIRRIPPKSAAEFGRTVEFDIDLVGDMLRKPTILIQLPSWLPPTIAANVSSSLITDLSGVSYGYTKAIAYFLFEQIEVYQDTILLQEFSGDALWALSSIQGTLASGLVTASLTGDHDGSVVSISRNAAPQQLRLEIPFLGSQQESEPGFPLRAVTKHVFRIRAKLRKLEDLIECSDPLVVTKPNPWGRSDFQQQLSRTGTPIPFTTLEKRNMLPILLQLETTQVYTSHELQCTLQTTPLKLPFCRVYESIYTQNQKDYAGVLAGGASYITRRLEGRHPVGKILFYFRSLKDVNANRLWKISVGNTSGPFYNTLTFLVAGQTREAPRTSLIWRDITNHAKEDIDSGIEINTINWTLGDTVRKRAGFEDRQPDGAVNFSTADKPTFYMDLALSPIDPLTGAPNTELHVLVEGWALYQTDGKGRGELFSMN